MMGMLFSMLINYISSFLGLTSVLHLAASLPHCRKLALDNYLRGCGLMGGKDTLGQCNMTGAAAVVFW